MTYLDCAATTPLDPEILQEMLPYLSGEFGNASSVHSVGRSARMAIERARNDVAAALGVLQNQVIFTSSASEANNLVLKGVIEQVRERFRDRVLEIVVSEIEHPCVIEAAKHLDSLGWAKVNWLQVDSNGQVRLEQLREMINENTVLVSVMHVNNEIGSVQPTREVGRLVIAERKRRKEESLLPIYYHCDAVQAIQYLPLMTDADFLTLAPHKYYGPKGIGILVKSESALLRRQIDGGGQEYYLRAGTENVAGIVGAAFATKCAVDERAKAQETVANLRIELVKELTTMPVETHILGAREQELFAPHIVSIILPGFDHELVIAALDQQGYAISSGSACSSGVVKKSHVIEALHLGYRQYAALRVSLDKNITNENISDFTAAMAKTLLQLKNLSL